jgi:hypothetical protein
MHQLIELLFQVRSERYWPLAAGLLPGVVIAIVFFLQDHWSGRVTAAYLGLLMVYATIVIVKKRRLRRANKEGTGG